MIGGTNVKTFPAPPLPTLGELAEGTLVKMNESGAPVEFYVAKHDYESELNGAGRTLVVRKDCYDSRPWHNSDVNAWESCALREWLNGDYKALLDIGIQELMGTTTYRYTIGNGNDTVTTRSDAVLQLSLTELGLSHANANVEGSALPIGNTLRIAYRNGNPFSQWLRSPNADAKYYAFRIEIDGRSNLNYCSSPFGSRPCFTLPSTVLVDEAMNIVA